MQSELDFHETTPAESMTQQDNAICEVFERILASTESVKMLGRSD